MLAAFPCPLAVLSMPSDASFGSVPYGSSRTGALQMLGLRFRARLIAMVPEVFRLLNQLEIARIVVARVVVAMVDMESRRNVVHAIRVHPHFLVESSHSSLLVGNPGREVSAVGLLLSVRVSTELDSLENDCLDTLFHASSLSAYRSASKRTQPFASTHTG